MKPEHEVVKSHYDRFPYPTYPFFLRGDRRQLDRVRVSLWQTQTEPRNILVAGCGTVAGFMFGQANPQSRVLAVDLSQSSLDISRRRCGLWGVRNVQHQCLDLFDLTENFDAIDAYGVLHHTENPEQSLRKLYELLSPGGVMRVMLYSKSARENYENLRRELRDMNIVDYEEARAYIKQASGSQWGELNTRSGFADALLHPLVHCFDQEEVEAMIGRLDGSELLSLNCVGNFVFHVRKIK